MEMMELRNKARFIRQFGGCQSHGCGQLQRRFVRWPPCRQNWTNARRSWSWDIFKNAEQVAYAVQDSVRQNLVCLTAAACLCNFSCGLLILCQFALFFESHRWTWGSTASGLKQIPKHHFDSDPSGSCHDGFFSASSDYDRLLRQLYNCHSPSTARNDRSFNMNLMKLPKKTQSDWTETLTYDML